MMELSTVNATLLQTEAPKCCEHKFRELHEFRPATRNTSIIDAVQTRIACNQSKLASFIPILKWLPRYDWKENLMLDVIAGLTVSVLQVPHGLAFAPLAYQQPVVGLYMAIFPTIMYVIFGTSRHLSLGMMGILIMMVGGVVTSKADFSCLHANETATASPVCDRYSPLQVAITVTFAIGLWQLLLGLFHLGSLCVLLSNSLVSGLTAAASIHIIVIQLKNIFGLKVRMATGPLKIFFITFEIFRNIGDSNYVSALTSLAFFLVLVLFNELVKPIIAKKTKVPIPTEFIMIALSILVSELLSLEENYGVKAVGSVPSGLPALVIPSFSLLPNIIVDSLVLALVSISFNISLGKVFAKKGGYNLDDNQELVAYGMSNMLGGFLQCLPVSASLSRSMVQFAVGGRTEMAHLISLLSVLMMVMLLGPLFARVPLCVLAAIVMATLKGLLMQIADFPAIWRSSKQDGAVWLVTFISVVLVDLDYGIGFGLVASILTLLISVCTARVICLNQMPNSKYLVDSKRYQRPLEDKTFIALKIIGNVNFFNCSQVSSKILAETCSFTERAEERDGECSVVVDFSCVPSVDPSAVSEITSLAKTLKERNCSLIITGCCDKVYDILEKTSFFDKFPKDSVIVNALAAVTHLKDKVA